MNEPEVQTIQIERAHRTGSIIPGKTRNIIAKLNPKGKTLIQRNMKNLNEESKIKVTDQIPPETQEKRNKLWPQFIQAKREKKSAKFINDKLLIDNKIVLPPVDRNRNITRDITDEAIQMQWKNTEVTTYNGNHFQGHTVDIKNEDDVVPAMKALVADSRVSGAAHVMYAYKAGSSSYYISNWTDDGEWGSGRILMNILEENNVFNKILCVTRWTGQNQLGRKRFELIKELGEKAIGH